MSTSKNYTATTVSRRKKRWESKKRKIEAFLNLIAEPQEEESVAKAKKIKTGNPGKMTTVEEDFQNLLRMKDFLKKKETEGEPAFFLTEHGLKAQINFVYYNKDNPLGKTILPLLVEDVQHLLLRGLLGENPSCSPRWCKIIRDRESLYVVLFIIDGLSKDTIVNNASQFTNMLDIFSDMVEILTPDSYALRFASELSGVHLSLGHRSESTDESSGFMNCNSVRTLTTIFPTEDSCSKENSSEIVAVKNFSKIHLLLSPIQLVMENFPLPKSVFQGSKTDGYCFTKTVYSHVTPDSPLFALDCEMCRVRSGKMEVTKIALVNEKFEIVLNTLVKPESEVVDYLTKYSGVTEEMLASVETTLRDVQEQIQMILPSDAILCGQSLNFDLHSLKLIHPYVIDTSVIYNISGCRTKKAGLRLLSSKFLKEAIQTGEKGHDPIEDCFAAMKLVQLKLRNGPQFGDAILSGSKRLCTAQNVRIENLQATGGKTRKKTFTQLSTSFFSKLQNSEKTVCIIADKDSHSQYTKEMLTDGVKRVVKSEKKKIIKHSIDAIGDYNLTICHINLPTSELCPEGLQCVDNYIRRLYIACSETALFVTVATGLDRKNENGVFENALCMVKLKNNRLK